MELSPSPVLGLRIDPRIRQRRIEVRRAEGRRRLRAVGTAILLVLCGIASWMTLGSPLLDVDRRRVVGAVHTPAQAVLDAAGVPRGEAMVDVDEGAVAARVEQLPWVARATVRRAWPGTVVITVTERRPSAVTRTNEESWALLDIDGKVLEIVGERPVGLVALEGVLGAAPTDAQPGARATSVAGPLEVVRSLTPALTARTEAVVVVQTGEIALKLNPRGTVRLGTAEQVSAKVRAIETILASLDTANLAVLDVRFPSSPVLTRG
ncbi:MAG: cell division protein FtsQ/DivIB [Acidimicrobiales bacterium]